MPEETLLYTLLRVTRMEALDPTESSMTTPRAFSYEDMPTTLTPLGSVTPARSIPATLKPVAAPPVNETPPPASTRTPYSASHVSMARTPLSSPPWTASKSISVGGPPNPSEAPWTLSPMMLTSEASTAIVTWARHFPSTTTGPSPNGWIRRPWVDTVTCSW